MARQHRPRGAASLEQRSTALEERIESLRLRLSELQGCEASPSDPGAGLRTALEELRASLEELRATHDELRARSQELATAHQAARHERDRYEDLFHAAPDPYLVTSLRGVIREANEAAASLLGEPARGLVGTPLATFLPPAERQAFQERLQQCASATGVGGRAWEFRLAPVGGDPVQAAATVSPIRDARGRGVGLRWILRDVTERRHAEEELRRRNAELELRAADRAADLLAATQVVEELLRREHEANAALRESEEQFRMMADTVPGFLFAAGPDGGCEYVNDRFYEYTGMDPGSALGDGWADALRADRRKEGLARWKQSVRRGLPYRAREYFRGADGAYRCFLVQTRPLRDGEQAVRWLGVCTEIDDLVGTEEALRRAESRQREILDAVPQMIFSTDPRGLCDYVNQRWCEYTGLSAERSVGDGWTAPLHPADLARVRAEWEHARASGTSLEMEFRVRRADGTYRWCLGRVVPVRSADGGIRRWLGTCTDIDDRRRAEEALRTTELRVQQLLRSNPVVVFSCRPTKGFPGTYMSPNVREVFGYEPGEFTEANSFLDRVHPDDRPRLREEVRQLFLRGEVSHEYRFRHKNGDYRWARSDLRLIRNEAGRPAEVVGAWQDVTERRRIDEALKASEERLRLALRFAGAGSWDRDLASGAVSWSDECRHLFGFDAADPAPAWEASLERIVPEDRAGVEAAVRQAVAEGRELDLVFRIDRRGELRWVNARGRTLYDEAGRPVRMIGISLDITQLKRAETALRLISEASAVLASSLETGTGLAAVARLAVPALGEACAFDLREADGSLRRVAFAHADPELEAVVREMARRYPPDPTGPHPAAVASRTGTPQLLHGVSEDLLRRIARDGEHLAMLHTLGDQSGIAVPLNARGRILGALTIWSRRPGAFGPADLAVAEDLARRAAAAVDNARLYDELREAARSERRRNYQLRGATEAALTINAGLRPAEVLELMAQQARYLIGADRCVGWLWGERDGESGFGAVALSDRLLDEEEERVPVELAVPALAERTREEARPLRVGSGEMRSLLARLPVEGVRDAPRNYLAVPLTGVDNRPLGLLELVDRYEGNFTAEDEDLLVQLAQMAAAALENSRLLREASEAREELRQYAATLERRVTDRTRALEESKQQMEAFSYSVSHDLRAPIRAIQGYTEALLEDFGDPGPTAREYGARIKKAAWRMDALIQDLLAFSRLSRSEFQLTPCEVTVAVQEALEQLEGTLHEAGAAVTVEVPADLPAVMAHRATLVQMLANLVSNAVKFVEAETRPAVRIGAEARAEAGGQEDGAGASLGLAAPRPTLRLWVEDNGIGIAPEYHERIFRVFERLHGGERYPGTGVGLAIVRKGVERMGGRVGLESAPGRGSRFWLELPADRRSTPNQ